MVIGEDAAVMSGRGRSGLVLDREPPLPTLSPPFRPFVINANTSLAGGKANNQPNGTLEIRLHRHQDGRPPNKTESRAMTGGSWTVRSSIKNAAHAGPAPKVLSSGLPGGGANA